MYSLNGEIQFTEWDELCKYTTEKEEKFVTLQRYDRHIAKTQSWNPKQINITKNFIYLKNNSFCVEGLFFKQDGEMDGVNYE